MKILLASLLMLFVLLPSSFGGELQHKWKSPSFSGVGSSAHFLTIENQEFTRKADIKANRESEATRLLSEKENSNFAKFIDNLESRMYAEFSKYLSENVFGGYCGQSYTATTADGVTTYAADTIDPRAGNVDGIGSNCSGEYTFNGTTIKYEKSVTDDNVTLDIVGPDGSTQIILPLNDFMF